MKLSKNTIIDATIPLTILTSLIFAKAGVRVWFEKKRKDIFQAAVPEEQIILAKLFHHEKIELCALYSTLLVYVYSGEEKKLNILHKSQLSKIQERTY